MNRALVVGAVTALWIVATTGVASGFDHVFSAEIANIPDPPLLGKGEAYTDPVFGTEVIRVTDPVVDGFSGDRPPGYACFDMENCNGSFLALADYLYDLQALGYVKKLGGSAGLDLGGDRGIRWDPGDPDVFYFVEDTKLMKYQIGTDTRTMVHDFRDEFPDMVWLLMAAYVEPSVNRRYWGFAICADRNERGQKIAAATYDMWEDRVVGVLRDQDKLHRAVNVSPSGRRVKVGNISYCIDFSDPVELPIGTSGHSDMAISADGREVYVIMNGGTDHIDMIDLETGERIPLLRYTHNTTWQDLLRDGSRTGYNHVSGNCTDTPGWVLISCEGEGHTPSAWMHQRLFLLELRENPRIWSLAHDYADTALGGYWHATHASINQAGTRVTFGSSWWGSYDNTVQTFQVRLPDDWYQELMGAQEAADLRSRVQELLDAPVDCPGTVADGGTDAGIDAGTATDTGPGADENALDAGSDQGDRGGADRLDPAQDAGVGEDIQPINGSCGCSGSGSSPGWIVILLVSFTALCRMRRDPTAGSGP